MIEPFSGRIDGRQEAALSGLGWKVCLGKVLLLLVFLFD